MGVDYYGILSLQRNCNELDIRKAYRNLALEFNPERLKEDSSQKVFSLIGEAYEVLSCPLRRAVFDQYGEDGLKRGAPTVTEYIQPYHYHGDPMRTYKEFFGTASPYADLLDHLKDPPIMYDLPNLRGIKKKQKPIYHPLCLSLHEIFVGGVKKMKVQRLQFKNPNSVETELKESILSVPIKPGIKAGTEIVFPEEGDQNPAHISSDIIFVINEREHECFSREGNNLIMYANLSLEDAMLGTRVTVNTIDHRTIRVPITDMVSPGYEKIVPNEGMPILENPEKKGDLIIKFKVSFPQSFPTSCKTMLQKVFHMAKVGGGMDHEMINKIVLADKIMRVDPCEQLPPF